MRCLQHSFSSQVKLSSSPATDDILTGPIPNFRQCFTKHHLALRRFKARGFQSSGLLSHVPPIGIFKFLVADMRSPSFTKRFAEWRGTTSFGLVRFIIRAITYQSSYQEKTTNIFKGIHSDNCSGLKRKLRHVFFDAAKRTKFESSQFHLYEN